MPIKTIGRPIAPRRKRVSRPPTEIRRRGPAFARKAALCWAGMLISHKKLNSANNRIKKYKVIHCPDEKGEKSKVVKSRISRWLSKKLHMSGVRFLYYFGVLEYVVMI
jgi:hypothetical protein